ncbi:MAG: hypothetical protein MUE97_07325, partial [Phycisphaerales bacterium]|nr:hypothetical protein [Phycisphaerales bacterium]
GGGRPAGAPGAGARPERITDPAEARAARETLSKPDERGREQLVLESPRHAVANLSRLLAMPPEQSDELMLAQLISNATKRRMVEDGGQPADAVAFLRENSADIRDLLRRMPFAEQSLDVELMQQGRNVYQLRLRRSPSRGLRYDSVWVTLEGGQWKFLWER